MAGNERPLAFRNLPTLILPAAALLPAVLLPAVRSVFLVGNFWQWGPEGPRKLQPGDTVWPGYTVGTIPDPTEGLAEGDRVSLF